MFVRWMSLVMALMLLIPVTVQASTPKRARSSIEEVSSEEIPPAKGLVLPKAAQWISLAATVGTVGTSVVLLTLGATGSWPKHKGFYPEMVLGSIVVGTIAYLTMPSLGKFLGGAWKNGLAFSGIRLLAALGSVALFFLGGLTEVIVGLGGGSRHNPVPYIFYGLGILGGVVGLCVAGIDIYTTPEEIERVRRKKQLQKRLHSAYHSLPSESMTFFRTSSD